MRMSLLRRIMVGNQDSTRGLFDHISPVLTIISDGRTVDTSATGRYSTRTGGWNVLRRNGGYENRKCVTTRNDGTIEVIISPNQRGIGSAPSNRATEVSV